eukprot:6020521-Amphidinium_carterae.1
MQETSSSVVTSSSSSKACVEGTYRYMSPERLTDSNSDHPAADIYSFAMVMTMCIAGRLVLQSDGQRTKLVDGMDFNWVVRIAKGHRPELPSGTRDLETYKAYIEECWHGDPTQRPSSEVVAKQHLHRVKQLRLPE